MLRTVFVAVLTAATLSIGGPPSMAAAPAAPSGSASGAATSPDASSKPSKKHRFASPRDTGVPHGWKPRKTVNGDKTVRRDGAVVKNLRIMGNLTIAAANVTVRRVDIVGGSINNWAGSDCQTGLKVRRSTIRRAPGEQTSGDDPALQAGGYVAERVKVSGLPEGLRVGGKSDCGRVVVRHSFVKVTSPDQCGDWHGDALQGYDGGHVKIRNSRFDLNEKDGCGGTAPFFYPRDQGNTSVDIDGLIVNGGGYSFRLGMPGDVRHLKVVKGGYYYGPIDVRCSAVDAWSADIVKLGKLGQPRHVRHQKCNTNGGY